MIEISKDLAKDVIIGDAKNFLHGLRRL